MQLTVQEQAVLDSIHRKYPYEDLLSWRRLVYASKRAKEDRKKRLETKKNETKSFFNRWFGSKQVHYLILYTIDIIQEDADEPEGTALAELFAMIGYSAEGTIAAPILPPDYIQVKIDFRLAKTSIEYGPTARHSNWLSGC